jgi:Transcriptional regulatory protein, C terminal
LVLGFRRWLDYDRGELPCATQAASWLDVKRTYMQLRPKLRRIYVVVQDVATYWPIVERLGFRPLTSAGDDFTPVGPQLVGSAQYSSVVLDFGPGSVDGWLARLVAAELGVGQDPVDDASHELVRDGERVRLTPLEFGLLKCLDANAGKAMSRAQLLEEVWGYEFNGESNVVNMVVTTLRHKLGPHAELIQTIRGVGYRLDEDWKIHLA